MTRPPAGVHHCTRRLRWGNRRVRDHRHLPPADAALSVERRPREAFTLTFPVGTTSQTVAVPITNDTTEEFVEPFTLTLGAPVHAALGTATATVSIRNIDGAIVGNWIVKITDNVRVTIGVDDAFGIPIGYRDSALDVYLDVATNVGILLFGDGQVSGTYKRDEFIERNPSWDPDRQDEP